MKKKLYHAIVHFSLWDFRERDFDTAKEAAEWCGRQTAAASFRYYQVIQLTGKDIPPRPQKKDFP